MLLYIDNFFLIQFGKGVYFADISSKSANYCYTTKKKNVGFLILSQVSLGNQKELLQADMSADKLPKDVHSVKGVGMVWPNPEKNIVWLVPFWKLWS